MGFIIIIILIFIIIIIIIIIIIRMSLVVTGTDCSTVKDLVIPG
jgi:hypothetical protein